MNKILLKHDLCKYVNKVIPKYLIVLINCIDKKNTHLISSLQCRNNSSPRKKGYWKLINNLLSDDENISKTKITIGDYNTNNPVGKTYSNTRWEALKCFLSGHTNNYSCKKKKKLL